MMYFTGKLFQAIGIVIVMGGLILGMLGDMGMLYYYFFTGIGVFLVGGLFLKRTQKPNGPDKPENQSE